MSKLITADQARGVVRGVPFEWEGRLRGRGPGTPNVWTGNGPPSTSTLPGYGATGDFYWDKLDGQIYWCSAGGLPGTWTTIAGSPYYCSVYQAVSQTFAASVASALTFDTVASDPQSMYSTSTHEFTPIKLGLWLVTAAVSLSADATDATSFVSITKNGGGVARGQQNSGWTYVVSAVVDATNLTDVFEIVFYPGSQAGLASNPGVATVYCQFTYIGVPLGSSGGGGGGTVAPVYARTVPTIPSGGWTLNATNNFSLIYETSSLFRTTVVVPASGMVRVRAQTSIQLTNGTFSDVGLFAAVVGTSAWTTLWATEIGPSSSIALWWYAASGEAVLTGLAPGSTTFMLGWATNQANLAIPSGYGGIGVGTWLEVLTLP